MMDGFGRCNVYAAAGFSDYDSDSSVFRDRFGLRYSRQLRAIEADISADRQSELVERFVKERDGGIWEDDYVVERWNHKNFPGRLQCTNLF